MKSILIVNNTKGRCKGCPLLEVLDYNEEECKCYMTGFDVTDVVAEDKYAYTCPLKPLPQKRENHKAKIVVESEEEVTNMKILINQCCDIGFNACIDEILGEEE